MKRKSIWMAVAAIAMTVAMPACSSGNNDAIIDDPASENNEFKPISLTRAQEELVTKANDFAFNLFRQVTQGENPKSTILSPISITYALGMLNNGAAGETQKQINTVLGFGDTGAEGINAFCQKMLKEAPTLDKLTKVMIANNIYVNKDYELNPTFVKLAKQHYDATPETRDFHDGKTCDVINKWGSDHTEGMIDKVMSEDEFNADAVSYLLNAIYFKGIWKEKFNKDYTRNEAFKCEDGTTKQLPMMRLEHEFKYTDNELCQAMSLPYGNGAYKLTVLLPREGRTIDNVLKTLNSETWQKYSWMSDAIVNVKLPRFESKTDVNLNDIMSALGMPKAFDRLLAEFPNFCNVPTYIGMMKQVARIKLDEKGTEAAAVTVIGVYEKSSISEPRIVNFHATRPFLYVISEQSTGAIFFIGKYVGD